MDSSSPSTPPEASENSRGDPKDASVVLGGEEEEVVAVLVDDNLVRTENASPVEAIKSRDAASARHLLGDEFIMTL